MNVALSSTIFWQRWQKRAIPMLVFHHDERRDESHTGPLTSENVRGIWKSGVHWQAARYEKECQDDMYSKSGDQSGSCSHHGGNLRPLYGH
jgi:hypothetical protein